MIKKITFSLYIVVVAVMAAATFCEKLDAGDLYHTWWFTLLWALLTAAGIVYIAQSRLHRWPTLLLHAAFVVILAGALLTRLTARRGAIHLRQGQSTAEYMAAKDGQGMEPARLPFKVKLEKFNIRYHEGTKAAADYESIISIGGDGAANRYTVSMNRIASHGGVRLYQSSYDEDGRGSVLAINSDPYGIPVTYVGYALLFFSLLWLLVDPRGTFRRLLRSDVLRKGALAILALMALQQPAAATTTFPRRTADHFGRMSVLYNDRIAPLQTYAYDLTKKLCGKRSYRGCTPEQVLTGFIFWGDQWAGEKIIKVKGGQLKSTLQLPDYVSVNDLFLAGDYRLKQYVEEYYHGAQDGFHQDAVELDEKVQLIMELRGGAPLKIFPHTAKGSTQWYAPNRSYKGAVSARDSAYMQQVFADLYRYALSGSNADVNKTIDEVMAYQQRNGGAGMPSPREVEAERLYNSVPFATILFVVNLTLGLIALGLTIRKLTGKDDTSARPTGKRSFMARLSAASGPLFVVLMVLSMLALTVALALRWIISGYVPMSNGYETMLVVAWFTQLLSLLAWRKAHIVVVFGFLLSGFFLLVSHISQMDPAIGRMMPVLNSPLLSIHVGIIMMSYALLAMTFICGLMGLLLPRKGVELQALSRLFLYPAVTTLGLGIFIGAIWANISWGTYWSWDPKETWALITFMVYAVVLHTRSFPLFSRPTAYHLYTTIAFLTILMTYFGVNYFLGGMHSYA